MVRINLTGFTVPLPNALRTQIYKLLINTIYTSLNNIHLIQETQIQLTNECRHAPKRHDSSVLCPPDPLRTLAVPFLHRWCSSLSLSALRHHDPNGHLSPGSLRLSSALGHPSTIVDTSSIQRRTSTLSKRAPCTGIHPCVAFHSLM